MGGNYIPPQVAGFRDSEFQPLMPENFQRHSNSSFEALESRRLVTLMGPFDVEMHDASKLARSSLGDPSLSLFTTRSPSG